MPGLRGQNRLPRLEARARRNFDGLAHQSEASESEYGVMLQAANVAAPASLTDDSDGTSGSGTIAAIGVAITDPADTPVDADALRDDLVANTIPAIETELTNLRNAVATLAEAVNDNATQIGAILTALQDAGIMAAS